MKCVLITFVTPAPENVRGTSALPYHLMKGCILSGSNMTFGIYSFDSNGLSDEKTAAVEKDKSR